MRFTKGAYADKAEEEAPVTRRVHLGWRSRRPPFFVRVWRYSPIVSVSLALAILVLIVKLVLGVVRWFIG